ncbi:hypothetical protein D7X33_22370 [Butyricicoccus sp. 1XD8-22]|nr:hypothetical protein D7X33_22370 [Butyricicoccus sp. 1XD8-22]
MLNNNSISIDKSAAQKDYRRNDISLLICNAEGKPIRLIYTKPHEKEVLASELKEINTEEIVEAYYSPISEIHLRKEQVYIGMCDYGNFHIYEQIL